MRGTGRYADDLIENGTTTRGTPARIHGFHAEGVKVKVPHQNARGKHGRPIAKEIVAVGSTDSNKPGRVIINLALEDLDEADRFVNAFDPPLEVRVRITPDDVRRAGGRDKVRLVYWDPASRRWEVFPGERVSWDGDEMEVQIDQWPDDPPIGTAP